MPAGISVDYVTRLEQGRATNPSSRVGTVPRADSPQGVRGTQTVFA